MQTFKTRKTKDNKQQQLTIQKRVLNRAMTFLHRKLFLQT